MSLTGETFYEKTKGKDVRTSNILAAKVGFFEFDSFILDINMKTHR